jgi:RNA polymerase sigma-70 factor (ECF subfamily)
MADPDAHLAAACRAGDTAALELLFRRYVDRVWRYGWLVTRSREAAGDIVQDTFLRVQKSIADFQGRSTFATWLFAVTRSAATEWLRKQRQQDRDRAAATILRLVPQSGASESGRDDEDSRNAVRQALADLPAAQRDAVILCELIGMSIAEAAEVLGWGQSRVKVTVFRARRKLREVLQPFVADDGRESSASEGG